MAEGDGEWMVIARVAGSFGVRGELKVEPYSDYPERFKRLRCVYLGSDRRECAVLSTRPHMEHILVRLNGVDTPEQAAALRDQELAIPRNEAWPLSEGQYYLDDLVGVTVTTEDGRVIGSISEVIRTGSNDVYVVGRGRDAVLVPGIKAAVPTLDLSVRTMIVADWVLEEAL